VSPLDAVAQEKWQAYSQARDEMLTRTHTEHGPWWCVRADHKHTARLNVISHLLRVIAEPGGTPDAPEPDHRVLFPFEAAALRDGRLAG
jgi:hypothetical protein